MIKPSAIINRNLHILVPLNKFFLTKSSMLHDLKSRFAIFCMIFKVVVGVWLFIFPAVFYWKYKICILMNNILFIIII